MACPNCDAETVAFDVPAELRAHAPGEAPTVAICTRCLVLDRGAAGGAPDFERIASDFPDGDAGRAMALAVGLLVDSVALHRHSVSELFERVADDGVDPWLVLERLARAGSIDTDADLDRIRRQLEQLQG